MLGNERCLYSFMSCNFQKTKLTRNSIQKKRACNCADIFCPYVVYLLLKMSCLNSIIYFPPNQFDILNCKQVTIPANAGLRLRIRYLFRTKKTSTFYRFRDILAGLSVYLSKHKSMKQIVYLPMYIFKRRQCSNSKQKHTHIHTQQVISGMQNVTKNYTCKKETLTNLW